VDTGCRTMARSSYLKGTTSEDRDRSHQPGAGRSDPEPPGQRSGVAPGPQRGLRGRACREARREAGGPEEARPRSPPDDGRGEGRSGPEARRGEGREVGRGGCEEGRGGRGGRLG